MLVHNAVNGQGIRRRLVAKQPAPQQLAEPVAKRRRLSEKQPVPALLALPPLPAVAVLPVDPNAWGDLSRDAFDEYSHRKQYRTVYNKFGYWWWRTNPKYVQHEHYSVTEKLWMLAKRDFGSLSKQQTNALMRHFLFVAAAPDWIMKFACRQWPVDAGEDRPRLILKSHTVLLTYQGDWGLLELGPDLPPNPTTGQLTAYVQALPEAEALWTAFSSYACDLAADLHAPAYACCLEICVKTFEQEKLLRLHAHVFMRSQVRRIRSGNRVRLRFKDSDPHLMDTLWVKKSSRSNWAGAYYCLAPKLGLLYQCGSVERFRDFRIDPSWVLRMFKAEKLPWLQEAKTELIRCGKGLVRQLTDLECWHRNRQDLGARHGPVRSDGQSRGSSKNSPYGPPRRSGWPR